MRLLHTKSFTLKEFHLDEPQYAILSHTWDEDEILYQDLGTHNITSKKGWLKLQSFCYLAQTAFDEPISWVWVDTCCIDKSNAAELQESINSMFKYYTNATRCIVYLADVPPNTHPTDDAFKSARWWK